MFGNESRILITGGTGSFGKAFVKTFLAGIRKSKDWLYSVVMN